MGWPALIGAIGKDRSDSEAITEGAPLDQLRAHETVVIVARAAKLARIVWAVLLRDRNEPALDARAPTTDSVCGW